MGLIDFILNLAGLMLWLNWLAIRFDPLARRPAATLAGTLRKAQAPRIRRWMFIAGLGLLLATRAFVYWLIGPAVNWTPKLGLHAITLAFPLSLAPAYLPLMLLYSLLSFANVLAGFYLWLLFLSFLDRRGDGQDPILRLARAHLGPVALWPWGLRLALPLLSLAVVWLALSPMLMHLQMVPPPASWAHRAEQGLLLGFGIYLAWKYLIAGVLMLHILNSYVYLGNHPIWNFVTVAAQNLLRPFNRLRLRTSRVDFAPVVMIALVFLLANLAENGQNLPKPFAAYRLPSLAELYQMLPF